MTDAEKITNLMDTQRTLVSELDRIAKKADLYAEQIGDGSLLRDIRYGFERIAMIARGGERTTFSIADAASLVTMAPLLSALSHVHREPPESHWQHLEPPPA